MQQPIQIVLVLYGFSVLAFAVLSLVLWRREKEPLFLHVTLMWFAWIFGSLFLSYPFTDPIHLALVYPATYPAFLAMATLPTRLLKLPFPKRATAIVWTLGIAIGYAAAWLGLDFTAVSLPMVLAAVFPILLCVWRIYRQRSGVTATIHLLLILNLLHVADVLTYPFLRLNPNFAPYGFGIACVLILSMGVIAPLAILEYARGRVLEDEKRARQAAEEAKRARDEFISIASHEIRTPLTPLRLQLDIVRKLSQISGLSGEKAGIDLEAALKSSQAQIDRLSRLTRNLLDLSRVDRHTLELELTEFDLGELVQQVVDQFHEELEKARCDAKIEIEGHARGRWDRMRLEQVIINLVTNAMKFGCGKPIEISVRNGESSASLTVRDHGIGIDPAHHERVFERFERGVPHSVGGLGLGLFISRQLVHAHGGSIALKSSPGDGSEFTVKLPLDVDAQSHGTAS